MGLGVLDVNWLSEPMQSPSRFQDAEYRAECTLALLRRAFSVEIEFQGAGCKFPACLQVGSWVKAEGVVSLCIISPFGASMSK